MPNSAHRILVVDDEHDMAQGLRRLLAMRGYEVDVAHSGEEAVDSARKSTPDGILMDLQMPGINGVEAYRRIRSHCPDAFVIFMTAFSHMADQAVDEDPIDVLTKPLDPEATCNLISKALSRD